MKIRHILVEHNYQAEDIVRLLQTGGDFSLLAQKYSTCPSGKMGGDLGDLTGKKLDEDFEFAASRLKPGETSGPVRTRFGYHLIHRY